MRYQTHKFIYDDGKAVYVVYDNAFGIEIGAFETNQDAMDFKRVRNSQDKIFCG